MVRIICALTAILFAATPMASAFPQETHDTLETKFGNPKLREDLLAMEVADQDIRQEFIKVLSVHPTDSLALVKVDRKMYSLDSANTAILKRIIDQYGWPGRDLVGREGTEAAFLILQHSPDTLFQRECVPFIKKAYYAGEVTASDFSVFIDRVLVREGKPQLYGTQANIVDGRIILDAIADSANVDTRRAKLGLPSLAEYIKLLRQVYHLKSK